MLLLTFLAAPAYLGGGGEILLLGNVLLHLLPAKPGAAGKVDVHLLLPSQSAPARRKLLTERFSSSLYAWPCSQSIMDSA